MGADLLMNWVTVETVDRVARAVDADLITPAIMLETEQAIDEEWSTAEAILQIEKLGWAIRYLRTPWPGNRESIETSVAGGEVVYMTGGMSWGDTPTEAYDAMMLINTVAECIQLMEVPDE